MYKQRSATSVDCENWFPGDVFELTMAQIMVRNAPKRSSRRRPKRLNIPNVGDRHTGIDCGGGDRPEVGAVDPNERCAKVKERVDASKLLQGKEEDAGESTVTEPVPTDCRSP